MIEVTGTVTIAGERWCLEVREREYRRVLGEHAWLREKGYRERYGEETEPWRLYPEDLMPVDATGRVLLRVEAIPQEAVQRLPAFDPGGQVDDGDEATEAEEVGRAEDTA